MGELQRKRLLELELMRAMCADGTLLSSEARTAPVVEKPPAGPDGGGVTNPRRREHGDDTPPVAFALDG